MCHLLSSKTVKTRKSHVCFGCEGVQPRGAVLMTHKNVGDGRIYTLYLCGRCDDATSDFFSAHPHEPYWQGELKDYWKDS